MIEAWYSNVSKLKTKNHTLMCYSPLFMNLIWRNEPQKCFVSPIKHAFADCNGRSKEYMKFRGKIGGKKNESEETQMSNRRLWHYRSAFNCMHND